MDSHLNNYAFIDGQNLYMGTTKRAIDSWKGDGDYKQLVDFLIIENKFGKILFPAGKRVSSLYKKLGAPAFASLDNNDTRKKIEMKKAP